ncbi:outer membrane beta-barrel protein [Helicobacter sp. 11S02596-1]|uniref:outer membrane beta-barrel protein n=1 Tax=Helicobacter sp. 11S02596-1 TaxID=1476194 RepID=UPI000BA60C9E|nr:outer membrane beta-barrel protein [Helicobacter sp. 11S02596-1]PAF42099.1 hypothetical protein BJI48_07240 [Helicobacter sp. 11S02596-1]
MWDIKKIFIAGACLFAMQTNALLAEDSIASQRSGLFIGPEIGGSIAYVWDAEKDGPKPTGEYSYVTPDPTFNILLGGKIGWQQYFNAYNGLRAYGVFNWVNFKFPNIEKTDSFLKYSINLDYVVSFSKEKSYWGMFAGLGYQWVQSKTLSDLKKALPYIDEFDSVNNNGLLINIGVLENIDEHHQIEAGIRIPVYYYAKGEDEVSTNTLRSLDIYLAYNYKF